ncbi:MAG: hypothetical protein F4W91_11980 [Gemmatimonadetes bacterium]|nr:hypothetical protein [Gemmatimonadota bacterium]
MGKDYYESMVSAIKYDIKKDLLDEDEESTTVYFWRFYKRLFLWSIIFWILMTTYFTIMEYPRGVVSVIKDFEWEFIIHATLAFSLILVFYYGIKWFCGFRQYRWLVKTKAFKGTPAERSNKRRFDQYLNGLFAMVLWCLGCVAYLWILAPILFGE